MPIVELKGGPACPSVYGKQQIAYAMVHRGEHFLGGAILVKRESGNGYVWRHLICQGTELIMKGCLLLHDYDGYRPRLKDFGHRLVLIADTCTDAFGLRPVSGTLRHQLEQISEFYEHHQLRYASHLDILIDPSSLDIDTVLRRLYTVSVLIRRVSLRDSRSK